MTDQGHEQDEQDQEPRIFSVTRDAGDEYTLQRRDFLKVAAAVAGVVGLSTVSIAGASTPAGNKMLIGGESLDGLPKAHKSAVTALAFSRDGKYLASSGALEQSFKLWLLPDGELKKRLTRHADDVQSLVFSRDGSTLASGSEDGTVGLWQLPACDPIGDRMRCQVGDVRSVDFAPNGRILAAGGDRNKSQLWSLPERKLLVTLEGHLGRVDSVVFSPFGGLLASGGVDRTVRLWYLPSGAFLRTFDCSSRVLSVVISPDGRLLVVGCSDGIKIWTWPDGKPKEHAIKGEGVLALSRDGTVLATVTSGGSVSLWSLGDGALISTLSLHSSRVTAVVFSPDGKLLVTGDAKGNLVLWELDGEKRRWLLFDRELLETQAKYRGYTKKSGRMVCTCNTIWMPAGTPLPAGAVCVCNTITMGKVKPGGKTKSETTRVTTGLVCTCDKICTCDTICTCNTIASPSPRGGSAYYVSYWYPN